MSWMVRTGWFTRMASPIRGRLTLFRVRKALGVGSLLRESSASTRESSAFCCCSCFRQQQRWGNSAPLLSGHLQQRGGLPVPGHGSEALPLQWGDLAGQQAGATRGGQEADPAAGWPVGGEYGLLGGSIIIGNKWCYAIYVLMFSVPCRRSC